MTREKFRVVAVATLAALAVFCWGCSSRPKNRLPAEQEAVKGETKRAPELEVSVDRVDVPVSGAEPFKGPRDAPVTMLVFSDFECPFCGRVLPTLRELEQTYGARLRIVWHNLPLPFHTHARAAAEAALEAFAQGGNAKFWAMHDKLFANQRALTLEDLARYADEIGLDRQRFKRALAEHAHASALDAEVAFAEGVGAQATPIFFINGRPLQGAVATATFKALIEDELQRAAERIAKGVKPEHLYTSLTAGGRARARFEPARPRATPFESTVYNVPVSEQDPQRGPSDALVTYVVFGDFECEYTQSAMSTLAEVESKYGKDLRIVWKNRPMRFHEHAYAASRFAMEAFAQGGSPLFWRASALLFRNRTALTRADLARYGQELGLEPSKLMQALEGGVHDGKIEQDMELSRRFSFGPTTPMFVVNGRTFKGAQKRAIFELMVEEELPKARAKIAQGVPRARVYQSLIEGGKLAPFEVAPGTLAADAKKVHELAPSAKAPKRGAANPTVVIQQFADFECPFCREVQATLSQLLEQNGDTVQLVWRNYPLPIHAHAELAAEAALEAFAQGGDATFWAYHDQLFAHPDALSRADLESYAKEVGLDLARFAAALDTHRHRTTIHADRAAVDAIGEQVGTPAFLVNGLLIAGAQPLEVFKVAVQRALLRRAAAANAAGGPTVRTP